jgi:hypothetical protein
MIFSALAEAVGLADPAFAASPCGSPRWTAAATEPHLPLPQPLALHAAMRPAEWEQEDARAVVPSVASRPAPGSARPRPKAHRWAPHPETPRSDLRYSARTDYYQ